MMTLIIAARPHSPISDRAASAISLPLDQRDTHAALQVLRALMALSVFANHWCGPYHAGFIAQTQLSVDLFFAIEGFLAASFAFSSDASTLRWRPIWQRLARIYPLYLMALAAGVAATLSLALAHQQSWSPQLLLQAGVAGTFMLPVFSAASDSAIFPLNTPSWAIVLECWGFAAFWLLHKKLSLAPLAIITLAAMVAMLALTIHGHDTNLGYRRAGWWGGPPRMIFGFFGGALLYRLSQLKVWSPPRLHPAVFVLASIAIQFPHIRLIGLPLLLVAVPLIVWGAARTLQPAWLASLGYQAKRHAYAIYLFSYSVVIACREIGSSAGVSGHQLGGALSFFIMLTVLLIVSHLAVRIDERVRICRIPER